MVTDGHRWSPLMERPFSPLLPVIPGLGLGSGANPEDVRLGAYEIQGDGVVGEPLCCGSQERSCSEVRHQIETERRFDDFAC